MSGSSTSASGGVGTTGEHRTGEAGSDEDASPFSLAGRDLDRTGARGPRSKRRTAIQTTGAAEHVEGRRATAAHR